MTAVRTKFRKIKLSTATNAYDLLNDVCTAILAEPARIDMGAWFRKVFRKTFKPLSGRIAEGRRTYVNAPRCGTVGCIAGWMRTLTVEGFDPGEMMLTEVSFPAKNMLCGSVNERMRAHIEALFHGTKFAHHGDASNGLTPYPFPNHRVGTKAYARDVVANIRDFQYRFSTELRARDIA